MRRSTWSRNSATRAAHERAVEIGVVIHRNAPPAGRAGDSSRARACGTPRGNAPAPRGRDRRPPLRPDRRRPPGSGTPRRAQQVVRRLRVHRQRRVADLARPRAVAGEIDHVALQQVVAGRHLRLELAAPSERLPQFARDRCRRRGPSPRAASPARSGAAAASALRQLDQRRRDHPLLRPAGVLDRRHRRVGRRAVHQQPPAQEGRGLQRPCRSPPSRPASPVRASPARRSRPRRARSECASEELRPRLVSDWPIAAAPALAEVMPGTTA